MLDREETTGAPQPGLDFVGHEQRSVAATEIARVPEIVVVGKIDPFSLNRLDDEGGHLARTQRLLERKQIIERDTVAIGQQRSEAGAEDVVAVERESAAGENVESG